MLLHFANFGIENIWLNTLFRCLGCNVCAATPCKGRKSLLAGPSMARTNATSLLWFPRKWITPLSSIRHTTSMLHVFSSCSRSPLLQIRNVMVLNQRRLKQPSFSGSSLLLIHVDFPCIRMMGTAETDKVNQCKCIGSTVWNCFYLTDNGLLSSSSGLIPWSGIRALQRNVWTSWTRVRRCTPV